MGRTASNTVPANTEALKKKIKESAGRRIEFRIIGQPGLVLITQKTGVGVFYLFYSADHGDRARKLRLGEFPAITLADATRLALDARARVVRGEDPAAARAEQRASMSFQTLAEKFVSESPKLSRSSRGVYLACLKKDAFPLIGNKPATAVTTADVMDICKRIRARGKFVQAQRTKTTIGGLYTWAISEGYAKQNPAEAVPKQQVVKSVRSRSPTDSEIAHLWRTIDKSTRASNAIKIIIKLVILTGQRRSEVAGARVSEWVGVVWTVAGDVTKAGRVVVEGRMKNGTEQRVYLSRQALGLFQVARATCSVGDYFFPADDRHVRGDAARSPHIRGDSVTQAMKRFCDEAGIKDLSIHDMRRAVGNFLKDAGYGREVRDLILHHKDNSVDGVHYSSTARMESQCREAWQAWADHVSAVVSGVAVVEASDELSFVNLYDAT